MMIQSAGPFQHPRSVGQNYPHSNGNMYHRQPSYHHPHHHQVSTNSFHLHADGIFPENTQFPNKIVWIDSIVRRIVGSNWRQVDTAKWFFSQNPLDASLHHIPTLRRDPKYPIYLMCAVISIESCHVFLLLPKSKNANRTKWNWWHRTTYPIDVIRARNLSHKLCASSGRRRLQSQLCISIFVYIYSYLSETWLDHLVSFFVAPRFYLLTNASNFTCASLPSIFTFSGLFSLFFLSFFLSSTRTHKRNENIFLCSMSSWLRPIIFDERIFLVFEKCEKKNNVLMDFYRTLFCSVLCGLPMSNIFPSTTNTKWALEQECPMRVWFVSSLATQSTTGSHNISPHAKNVHTKAETNEFIYCLHNLNNTEHLASSYSFFHTFLGCYMCRLQPYSIFSTLFISNSFSCFFFSSLLKVNDSILILVLSAHTKFGSHSNLERNKSSRLL